jgi:acetolactate synthase-1/2/3 large subunit
MIGAEALVLSLVGAGVDVCFMNPGTSEMHFVHTLDAVPRMRGVLTLFEGVATGAADGYARIAGRPAAVLLHLGPGLGNGLANLHNARRAHTPLLCIVGAHASHHDRYDAPLQSDIEALARTVSGWVLTTGHPRDVARDAMAALAASRANGGQVATLVLPADASWGEGAQLAVARVIRDREPVGEAELDGVAAVLTTGRPTVLLLGGTALDEAGLRAASRLAQTTGVRLIAETFPAVMERGAGLPAIDRLAYLAEAAEQQLDGTVDLVLAGSRWPVSFFAYPGRPSDLVPEGCTVHTLADAGQDAVAALQALADRLASGTLPSLQPAVAGSDPTGPLTVQTFAEAVAVTLPEGAIVVDEANTSGILLPFATAGAPRHSWLTLTGGAIGQGLPVATGAAIAAPDRPVLCLEADGSAMYTFQSLWTQAREGLDVTTVLLNNGSYAILRMELQRVGAGAPGAHALDMLDLHRPDLDFTALAAGMGVDAVRVTTAQELVTHLRKAYAAPGPHLIEAMIDPIV